MIGKDFFSSKWWQKAQRPGAEEEVRQKFWDWFNNLSHEDLLNLARRLWDLLNSSETPPIAKVLIVAALLYLICPLDLIPDYLPLLGWVDDIAVASWVIKYVLSLLDEILAQGAEAAGRAAFH